MGIHTTIETNGYYGDKLGDGELDAIDLVMLGIKTWDPARHKALTGMDVGPTLAFARRLAARRRPIWIRFVMVPGVTDDMEDLAKTAEFAAGLGNVERVEVLPFHQMGAYKWDRLGLDYTLRGVEAPTPEAVERACEVFRRVGLKAF
jgi:pyruvate formate lyase activating enzyme